MHYTFLAPPRIVFGWGRFRDLGTIARTLGNRAFLILGSRTLKERGLQEEVEQALATNDVHPIPVKTISREPEVEDVDQVTRILIKYDARPGDFVLGIGGGSAIDLAKAAAAMATNRQSDTIRDYLEGVGLGIPLVEPPLPVMAVPTTAGTGSEATKNAVISSYDPPFKKSLRSDQMVPRVVLIDPELAQSVPPNITAHSGMDAITQLIESYLSRRAQPIPQALCLQGVEMAVPAVVEAFQDGQSQSAREKMAHAALLSGLALANSGLGMAHGVAAALGVHCRIAHGLACAVMLPVAMRVNREVRLAEMATLGTLMTGRSWPTEEAAAEAAVEHIQKLNLRLNIPTRLSELGVRRDQIPALVQSSRGNSMNGNPRELSNEELGRILENIL